MGGAGAQGGDGKRCQETSRGPGLRREFGELLWGERGLACSHPKHGGTVPPAAFWNVAESSACKAVGPGLWGQAHQPTGNP